MSSARHANGRRAATWAVAVITPLSVGAAILAPMAASGAVDLPDKTVAELLEFAAASDVDALSGTIDQTSELGLPDLEALGMGQQSRHGTDGPQAAEIDDLIALATGTHTANVYLDGRSARLQVLDKLAERNVYVDGAARQAWFVDSETLTATRLTLPDQPAHEPSGGDAPDAGDALTTPDSLLDDALARLDETTEVTVGTDARVAGREVYELILKPRTDDTLIGEIRFAIDGENGAALAASVTPRGGGDPAFKVAFSRVSFEAPDASVFAFTPGGDFRVADKELPLPSAQEWAQYHAQGDQDAAGPVVYGEGWSAVAEISGAGAGGNVLTQLDPDELGMLQRVTTPVDGGRVLQTSLVSVLITDDGRILAGAVTPSRLVEAAETGR